MGGARNLREGEETARRSATWAHLKNDEMAAKTLRGCSGILPSRHRAGNELNVVVPPGGKKTREYAYPGVSGRGRREPAARRRYLNGEEAAERKT